MSNGIVDTKIKNIVQGLPDVTYQQIIYEAITNSIQANANNININFISESLELDDTDKYIDSIVVEDDGDGFDEINTKSFKEYKSDLKRDLGCKGIGRFLYLKIFRKINICSLNKNIELVIDNSIRVDEVKVKEKKTILRLLNPIEKFVIDYENLEKNIKEHFIAYFKLLEDKKTFIEINIYENYDEKFKIKSSDIPLFKNINFEISKHNFRLDYILNDDNIKNYDGFYCAGSRVVIKNSQLDSYRKVKFFKNIKFLFILSSEYFDNNVNEARDNFTIYPKQRSTNLFNDLSWSDIQDELRNQMKIIAKENGIDIEKIANNNLKTAIESKPFLGHYLKDNIDILDSDTLIQNAKKTLEKDKDFLRENSDKMDSEYHHKLTIVTQSELAEYLFDRQKIIDKLQKLTDDNSLESEIHNLFMKQKTIDNKGNYRTNNLWLFDDRFMTYDKVFSDKQIKEIFPDLDKNLDRPDIISIVSNTYNKEEITDIVIIELKKADNKITPAGAEEQLLKYSRYIQQSNIKNSIRIWTYAFLKYSNDIDEILNGDKGYNKIPTHSRYPIYYYYFKNRNTIINFMDYRALASDANNRNKTFMKILKGETL